MSEQETQDVRYKRLRMRSWRRGIKEMDLILGPFADACLTNLETDELDDYEALLGENDHDLYAWVTERAQPPVRYDGLIEKISSFLNKQAVT